MRWIPHRDPPKVSEMPLSSAQQTLALGLTTSTQPVSIMDSLESQA